MAAGGIGSAAAKGTVFGLMSQGARRFHAVAPNPNFVKVTTWNWNRKRSSLSTVTPCCTERQSPAEIESQSETQPQEAVCRPKQVSVREAAGMLDIRVGRVVKAWRHEEAESLYVEEVDVGEGEARVICSGLVGHVALESLEGLGVLVLANLKPRNMRGVKSCGMLLAASDPSHTTVQLLSPPHAALPGHRVWFADEADVPFLPPPATPNYLQKKKIWELVQPQLGVDASGVAVLEGCHVMMTPAGPVTAPSLKNANIS